MPGAMLNTYMLSLLYNKEVLLTLETGPFTLLMRKERHRRIKSFSQGHTASGATGTRIHVSLTPNPTLSIMH